MSMGASPHGVLERSASLPTLHHSRFAQKLTVILRRSALRLLERSAHVCACDIVSD